MAAVSELQGKKIFFFHPSAVVKNQIMEELAQQEYEVYAVKDSTQIRKAIKNYPDSIIFIDINEQMPEPTWEKWVIQVKTDYPEVSIGVISSNKDEKLISKYVNQIKIDCGFTVIKSDLNKSIVQVLEALKAADAKGRRKYIRINTEKETTATVNLFTHGDFINGAIKDISVVGISCAFANDPNLEKNTLFKGIQIKLQTTILKVEAIVFGSRMDGNSKNYVLLFTQRIDPEVKTKIRRYIQQNLQNKMNSELK